MPSDPLPPNLREAVDIMADAVQGMYVFTDNRECIEAECAAALRALLAGGWSVTPPGDTLETLRHQRGLLAEALGKLLVANKVVRADAALTGPELLLAAETWIEAPSAPVGAADEALGPYTWACDTCTDLGWIDERAGGEATSDWVECPDCGNPHKGTHP